ncbi:MAG: lipopolysaccharide heptosyltransferase I [Gallionellaceae bacterium]
MLKILLIKTSSMGDVLHNLPVVTDICHHVPEVRIDWVVEENLSLLPELHPKVSRIFPVALRRWRKTWWRSRAEIRDACRSLGEHPHDLALDTQGLLKSALLSRCSHATSHGFDWNSAREPLASLFYARTYCVEKKLHAVERNRRLAGLALGYEPQGAADYGIRAPDLMLPWLPREPYVVLLHATSRDDKLWDESSWMELGMHLAGTGLRAVLPWGNDQERSRGARLCAAIPGAVLAPRINLQEAAAMLGSARAAVGVDTGLSHLAAALGIPTVGIYTATDPGLTGLYAGDRAINLGGKNSPPPVAAVWAALEQATRHA